MKKINENNLNPTIKARQELIAIIKKEHPMIVCPIRLHPFSVYGLGKKGGRNDRKI